MGEHGESADIITFRRPGEIDPEAAFREFRSAGLVNARFGVDGAGPLFWGYHDPDVRWNGWAVPGFIPVVAGLIAQWLNDVEEGSAWWEGETLCVPDTDRTMVDRIEPDELGLYRFDGWVWLESTTSHTP
jgi:hypothetical protein